MTLETCPDEIADCVLNTFNALPPKFKPRKLADGRRQWVPLAGIVLSKALATGMKCLPRDKIPLVKGTVLHDWHAEILCLRAFNRWILDECHSFITSGISHWLQRNETGSQPFSLQDSVRIHMFCTEAPCGDASMELIMSAQEDATPWTSQSSGMLGRGHFDQLGVVRRKPARADAPVCWSKSCSDKISLKACTGLLSGITSLLVGRQGCFLETLVLPEGEYVKEAVERAFGPEGRMKWAPGFRPFSVKTTTREFAFSKRAAKDAGGELVSSNLSAMWTPQRKEILINGVLQGRKQMDPKGASCVSRRRMLEGVREVVWIAGLEELKSVLGKERTYGELKACRMLEERERIKRDVRETALKEWNRNEGDEEWRLDEQAMES